MSVLPSEVAQNERTVHTNFFDGMIYWEMISIMCIVYRF